MALRETLRRFFRSRHGHPRLFGAHDAAYFRFEVPGLYGNQAVAALVLQCLERIDGIIEIHPNPRTGYVLVGLDSRDVHLVGAIEEELQSQADPLADPAPSFSRWVNRARDVIVLRWQAVANGASRNEPPRSQADISESAPFHARDVDDVCAHFRVSPETGLNDARVEETRRRFGRNVLAGISTRSSIDILADQLLTLPCALLFGAAGFSLLLGDVLEAGAIVLVIGSNIAVGYFSEMRAEELLHAWRDLRAEWATVVRNGQQMRIDAADLVPGDVLVVRAGDAIPADARLVDTRELFVDESMLTGECEPIEKIIPPVDSSAPLAERRNMLFAGTNVAAGAGRAIVVAIGERTELGNIERALDRAESRRAPMETQLEDLGGRVAKLAAASSLAVVGFGLLRGRPLADLLRSAIALGVAAIPEGFPAVGTTALALASHRLRRDGIVIRRLVAAETLGAVRVVCADKTGTLTENKMRVESILSPGHGLVRVEWPREPEKTPALVAESETCLSEHYIRDLLRIAALNADVEIHPEKRIPTGSGTEVALVEFAMALGYPVYERRVAARRIHERRRSSNRAFLLTVHEHPELGRIDLIKGAPEQIIARLVTLSEAEKQSILQHNENLASCGLRVLAFAWRAGVHEEEWSGFVFAGLVGLRDPPREGVRHALGTLSRAGITTHIVTGDQQKTALAMGGALGIADEYVHSRVTPVGKLEIVQSLQAQGNLVAMTGDGINDGPALKAADVGIAMGKRGTDIARAVADVVLAGDDLPSIVAAISEGRRLHDNVRRAIHYLAATNAGEVITMLFGSALGIDPLGPLQLLWINILTDIAPALALAIEPPDNEIMLRPPRNPDEPLFTPNDLRHLLGDASRMAAGALTAYAVGSAIGRGRQYGQTMAFLSLVTAQILYTGTCRAESKQPDPALRIAVATSFGLQALALGVPSIRRLLHLSALGPGAIAFSMILGAIPAWSTRAAIRSRSTNSATELGGGPRNTRHRETMIVINVEKQCT